MLPSEIGIIQQVSESITNPITYVILTIFIATLLYFTVMQMSDIPNSYKMVIAVIIPVFLLEFLLSILFSIFGINLDWGFYSYTIPFIGTIKITSGVMLSRFFDFVFNFGLFRSFGLPYFTDFAKTLPSLGDPGVPLSIFTAFYVSADSIIEFIFFFALFSAILSLLSVNDRQTYAIILALIPVTLYGYFISNPFIEFGQALPMLQQVQHFIFNAPLWSKVIFFGTLSISFLLVMEILATVIDLFYAGGASTLRPQWETKGWEVNYQGVAFGYTLAFAVMYALHEYAWYIFFPALIIYTLLKQVGGKAISYSNDRQERTEIREMIRDVKSPEPRHQTSETQDNTTIYALVLILIVFLGIIAFKIGLIKI